MRWWIIEKAAWKERGGLNQRYKGVRLLMYICNREPSMENMALSSFRILFSRSKSFIPCKQTVVEYLLSGVGFCKSAHHFNSHFVDTSFTTIGAHSLATKTHITLYQSS